jgi:N-acetylmuramoyl-L-alanine amidase
MFSRVYIIFSCLIVLSGCASEEEPTARIVYPDTEPKLVQPTIIRPKPVPGNIDRNIPRDWLPPSRLEKKWAAIVIHHSATRTGNAAIFDKKHREENHWEGVGYDFVIGNGTDSGDGQIEVTFRWRQQLTGAHCKTPNNWANENGIGICLVGNFEYAVPSARQMQSLVKLVRFLQNRYRIPKSKIYGHKTTPGARVTDCPGERFPMTWLKSMLYF